MKRLNRILSLALAAMMALTLLTGCGGKVTERAMEKDNAEIPGVHFFIFPGTHTDAKCQKFIAFFAFELHIKVSGPLIPSIPFFEKIIFHFSCF